jgi:hypothetical protein
MKKVVGHIPGYTFGIGEVATSPISKRELEEIFHLDRFR